MSIVDKSEKSQKADKAEKSGTSSAYRKLLRGEITSQEYVKSLRERARTEHTSGPSRRANGGAAA